MANTIRVKRSDTNEASTLTAVPFGELVVTDVSTNGLKLYVGDKGETGNNAIQIGGENIVSVVENLDTNLQTFTVPASTTISTFGASLVDDADAATARGTLGVDAAGTDNSVNVTLAASLSDVVTVSGQELQGVDAGAADAIVGWDDTAGKVTYLSAADATATLNTFNSTLAGLAPASGGGTLNFLRADGTWQTPPGGGNVSAVATPVDNQIAVWTSSTNIEGTTGLTYNAGTLTSGVADTTKGTLVLHGPATGAGGGIEIHNAANADTNTYYWKLEPNATGDLVLSSEDVGSTAIFTIDETTNVLSFAASPTVGANAVLDAGDIGVSVQGYDANTAKYNDATANFTGTLQNGGSNVLVDTDIGTNVQAYNANNALTTDVTYETLDSNGDIDTDLSDGAAANTVPSSVAVKSYVDSVAASEMTYKGGYNAATNSPDLDTSPSGVAIGDMYTVTTGGQFFAATVEAGDVLIAEQDNATLEAHWTVVNTNVNSAVPQARAINTDADSGLAGGGDLSADRSLTVDILGTTPQTTGATTDELLVQLSGGARRAMTVGNFLDGGEF